MKTGIRTVLSVLLAAILLGGCTPPPESASNPIVQSTYELPHGNFAFLVGVRPAAITESALFKRLSSEAYADEWQQLQSDLKTKLDITPGDVSDLVFTMEMPSLFGATMPDMLMVIHAPLNKEQVAALMEENLDAMTEIEDREYNGTNYIVQTTPALTTATLVQDEGVVSGSDEALQLYIDMKSGNAKSLMDREAVKEAVSLIHADAQASFVFWEVDRTLGPIIQMMASMAVDEDQKEAMALLSRLNSLVASATLDDGLSTELILLFTTAEASADFEKFYERMKAKTPELVEDQSGDLQISVNMLPKKEVERLISNTTVSRNGKMLKFSTSIPGNSPFWDTMIEQVKAEKERLQELEDGMREEAESSIPDGTAGQ